MASIFISYRREDTGGHAGRLCDRLTARFGRDRVFMDIQDIHPGQNFATSIEKTIATCDSVIAVIGPRWLETVQKRAESGDDFVRHEIGAALRRHVSVIPVLMGGARMPAAGDLPAELAELSFLTAIEIRNERFDRDVVELETFLETKLSVAENPAVGKRLRVTRLLSFAIPLLVIAFAIVGYFLLRSATQVAGDASIPASTIDGAGVRKTGNPETQVEGNSAKVADNSARVAVNSIGIIINAPVVRLRWSSTSFWHQGLKLEYETEVRLPLSFTRVGAAPAIVDGVRLLMDSDGQKLTWEGTYEADNVPLTFNGPIAPQILQHRTQLLPFALSESKPIISKTIDFVPIDHPEPLKLGTYKSTLQVKHDSSEEWLNLSTFAFTIPSDFELNGRDTSRVEFYRYDYWQEFELTHER